MSKKWNTVENNESSKKRLNYEFGNKKCYYLKILQIEETLKCIFEDKKVLRCKQHGYKIKR